VDRQQHQSPDDSSAEIEAPRHHSHRELQEIVREAVAEAMQAHVCRFDREEAGRIHLVARMDDSQIDALKRLSKLSNEQLVGIARMADALNNATTRVSQALVIGAFVGAVWVLIQLIKHGLIDP